ncbi:MAG: PA14 domain-containing protein [Anaerolineae bacterium]|nr:PA14 domain-containing protein [Anaerolineae bacterium]
MKRISLSPLPLLVMAVILLLAACGPTTTPTPTTVAREDTATPTEEVTTTATPTATSTAISAPPTFTPTPIPSTPTSTPTSVPPTATFTSTPVPPTPTPVPPTATLTPSPVPPTRTPTFTPSPVPPRIVDWRGEYYNNRSLQPSSVLVRNDRVVDFAFSPGQSPASAVPNENWSARWTRNWNFDEGNYRFHVLVDDGARLWVNDILIIDAWQDGAAREITANLYLRGQVPIRLEYYNHLGTARIRLNWEPVTQYDDWRGSYFPVRDLSGLPRFQRNDAAIDFNWGAGSPRRDIPDDNFSVRWSRRMNFNRTGTYRFRTVSDDGVRLWVDGRLVIDAWHDGVSTNEALVDLAAGPHDLRLDYYEHVGGAMIQLAITTVTPTATPTPTSTPTPVPPTPTFTPTPVPPTPTFTPTPIPPTPIRPTLSPIPPTLTPPPPLQPRAALQPQAGPVGEPINVTGSGWPANTQIGIFLSRPQRPSQLVPVGQAVTDATGAFRTQVEVPEGEGWEGQRVAEFVVRTPDAAFSVRLEYRILRERETIPFRTIPTSQERFALRQPTFLALDSASAWAANFGQQPPPADPPVDWRTEIVLGAFLGAQTSDVEAEVEAVVRRDNTVTVQLQGELSADPRPARELAEGEARFPRTLIRVSRAAIGVQGNAPLANLTFVFEDEEGQVLAQGPAGPEPLLLASSPEMRSFAVPSEGDVAPAPSEPQPEIQAVPQLEAPAEAVPEAEAPAEAVPSETLTVPAERTPLARRLLPLAGIGIWTIMVVGVVAGLWFLIRRTRGEG